MLEAIGVRCVPAPQLPFRCFLIIANDPNASLMLVDQGTGGLLNDYHGHTDRWALGALQEQLLTHFAASSSAPSPAWVMKLKPIQVHRVVEDLKRTSQYGRQEVAVSLEPVPVDSLLALTDRISSAAYVQARYLKELYAAMLIEPFSPTEVYGATRACLIPPPVVEESGNHFIVTQGLARAVFCRNHGIRELHALVVRKVQDPPPGKSLPLAKVLILDSRAVHPVAPPPLAKDLLRHPHGAFQLMSL
jgi:hypothetical protein